MKELEKGIWHKVSEYGLPETNDYILVYLRSRSGVYSPTVSMAKYYPDEEHWWIAVNSPEILDEDDEIVAWMEIPKYEEEQKPFLNSKSYKIDDGKLQVAIFYQNKGEWKLCCKGEGFSDAVSIESDKAILNIKNLEFDSDFAKSHDITDTDRWYRWLRFKVLFKGTATSINGKHPVDILCNNCEVLYQENDSLVLKALPNENGEKMQLIIEDDDNYKK